MFFGDTFDHFLNSEFYHLKKMYNKFIRKQFKISITFIVQPNQPCVLIIKSSHLSWRKSNKLKAPHINFCYWFKCNILFSFKIDDQCPIRYDDGRNPYLEIEDFQFFYATANSLRMPGIFIQFILFYLNIQLILYWTSLIYLAYSLI